MRFSRYFWSRFGQLVLTAFLIITFNFFLFRVLPGDPVRMLFKDPRIPPEALEQLRASFGLDKPVLVQYLYYLANLARGDMGISFVHREPVTELLLPRLFNTVLLVGSATLVAILLGVLLGLPRRGGAGPGWTWAP